MAWQTMSFGDGQMQRLRQARTAYVSFTTVRYSRPDSRCSSNKRWGLQVAVLRVRMLVVLSTDDALVVLSLPSDRSRGEWEDGNDGEACEQVGKRHTESGGPIVIGRRRERKVYALLLTLLESAFELDVRSPRGNSTISNHPLGLLCFIVYVGRFRL